jgi:hypothetical protein
MPAFCAFVRMSARASPSAVSRRPRASPGTVSSSRQSAAGCVPLPLEPIPLMHAVQAANATAREHESEARSLRLALKIAEEAHGGARAELAHALATAEAERQVPPAAGMARMHAVRAIGAIRGTEDRAAGEAALWVRRRRRSDSATLCSRRSTAAARQRRPLPWRHTLPLPLPCALAHALAHRTQCSRGAAPSRDAATSAHRPSAVRLSPFCAPGVAGAGGMPHRGAR